MTTYDAFAEFRMTGHTVVITGGAQNIGAGIAKTLAGAGANVMIADLNGVKAAATAAEIAAATGADCRGMACDITRQADIDAVVTATVAAFGGISTLVNNVGWGGRQENPAAIPEEEFIASYKLNTISAYQMSMAACPTWRRRRTRPSLTLARSPRRRLPTTSCPTRRPRPRSTR
jgi:7-alpha-hydroxysteroid dehydrogenase